MNKEREVIGERQLSETAARFSYPPTPDVAGRVRQRLEQRPASVAAGRRLAWALLLLLLLLSALLTVPAVRAAVREFLQIGALRILPLEATVTPAGTAPVQTAAALQDTATPSRPLLPVAGATTWEAAQAEAGFLLHRPSYPPGLGLPDEVYRQQVGDPGMDAPVIILVWYDEEQPEQVALALYQIAAPYYGVKAAAISAINEAAVQGDPAYWIEGSHQLQLSSGELREWLFVPGNVLVWVEGEITYRLEGAVSLEEAVRIAESLQPR